MKKNQKRHTVIEILRNGTPSSGFVGKPIGLYCKAYRALLGSLLDFVGKPIGPFGKAYRALSGSVSGCFPAKLDRQFLANFLIIYLFIFFVIGFIELRFPTKLNRQFLANVSIL